MLRFLLLFATTAVLAGCADLPAPGLPSLDPEGSSDPIDEEAWPPPDDGVTTVPQREARFPERHGCWDRADVAEARVELALHFSCDPADLDLQPGSVLLGNDGGGYLRRVETLRWEGTTAHVTTSEATLTDAFVHLHVRGELLNAGRDSAWSEPMEVLGPLLVVTPSITMKPTGDVDIDIEDGVLVGYRFTVDLNWSAELEVQIGLDDAADVDIDIPIDFAPDLNFGLPIFDDFTLGFTVHFETSLEVEMHATARAQLTTGVQLSGVGSIGYEYLDGDMSYLREMDVDGGVIQPSFTLQGGWVWGEVALKFAARPQALGFTGSSLWVKAWLWGCAHLELEQGHIAWELRTGVTVGATVGLELPLIGWVIDPEDYTLPGFPIELAGDSGVFEF